MGSGCHGRAVCYTPLGGTEPVCRCEPRQVNHVRDTGAHGVARQPRKPRCPHGAATFVTYIAYRLTKKEVLFGSTPNVFTHYGEARLGAVLRVRDMR